MAITRRQFVTRVGAIAAAMGLGQADFSRLAESLAYGHFGGKPKVLWVHGAECTGCSTSALGLFESVDGQAVEAVAGLESLTTGAALGAVFTEDPVPRTLAGLGVDGAESDRVVNIADVVVDVIDLQYHETIMGPGGDSAYKVLADAMTNAGTFVLVVEGAVQPSSKKGYWNKTGDAAWCSIAMDGTEGEETELVFADVVEALATQNPGCLAVIAIGQCATFGGYPACAGPDLQPSLVDEGNGLVYTKNQTGAQGVYDFLKYTVQDDVAADKVINVPGCPTNPWWFVLTVVAFLADANALLGSHTLPLGILTAGTNGRLVDIAGTAVDSQRRLKAVFGSLLHGKYCPRYADYAKRKYAAKPGEAGCLKNIGCKGLYTMALCTRHGWNGQQPQNLKGDDLGSVGESVIHTTSTGVQCGGNCITAGAPCMGCSEKGYPDAFVPYISQR